jgi:DNA-binding NtrC family response regulator
LILNSGVIRSIVGASAVIAASILPLRKWSGSDRFTSRRGFMTRILVVDDDPHVCETIRLMLDGHHVITTDNVELGLILIGESQFDLMIIDVCMPKMRGFESIRLFHHRDPDLPLIAISGYAFASAAESPDFLSLAIELGAWRCLRKPFIPAALLFVVKECLYEGAAGRAPRHKLDAQPATSLPLASTDHRSDA